MATANLKTSTERIIRFPLNYRFEKIPIPASQKKSRNAKNINISVNTIILPQMRGLNEVL